MKKRVRVSLLKSHNHHLVNNQKALRAKIGKIRVEGMASRPALTTNNILAYNKKAQPLITVIQMALIVLLSPASSSKHILRLPCNRNKKGSITNRQHLIHHTHQK